jgi:hypothetical protein
MHGWPTSRLGREEAARGAVMACAPSVPTAWSRCAVYVRDGAVTRLPVARWRLAGGKVLPEISRGSQGVPSKEEGVGAHQSGGPMVRWHERHPAAVFNDRGNSKMALANTKYSLHSA